jgi:DNA-binding response OmpR family regulator
MVRPIILIVEDDRSIFQALALLLRPAGYHVVHAPDSRSALTWLAAHTPALVVLDLWIPVDGGRHMAHAIRQQYGATVPVLLLTAERLTTDAVTVLGAVGYLRKPFDLDDVFIVVARLVPLAYGDDQVTS